ncbi:MAG: UDP-2,4-diacetamido-2,4,6-trideoxy-beta-L-altropyranose hydrolase [Bacteroidota bacterium]|nr:MAG: UDP-2,4-diacetamido-2,4,6-trideoxy-beta-L-altropyranose hydrolase [Bacteroidota bacterium]
MKRVVYIRVDGNARIGLGHLIRCVSLALMLKKKFTVKFICKEIPDDLKDNIFKQGIESIIIKEEEEFFELLSYGQIIVIDGYSFDYEYQRRIKEIEVKLVCIDDVHKSRFNCDILLNYTPGVEIKEYNAAPYTIFALGMNYILLRPSFLKQAKKPKEVNKMETVFICFGGSDPLNLTQKTLEITLCQLIFKKIIIVTGHANQNKAYIESISKNDSRIIHKHAVNEQEMLKLMIKSDVAIVPASSMLYEVLSVGCIPVTGKYVDNQDLVYEYFKKSGCIVDAGTFSSDEIKLALKKIATDQNKIKLIDGISPIRILKLFTILDKEFRIKLQKASISDLNITFEWANNEIIRQFAFNKHIISIEEHTNWFISKINNPQCFYYLAFQNSIPLGSIRFDVIEGEAIISYLVDPKYHGQGYGKTILKMGIEILMKELSNICVKVFVGKVFLQNIQSIRAFESLGFEKKDNKDYYKYVKWVTTDLLK